MRLAPLVLHILFAAFGLAVPVRRPLLLRIYLAFVVAAALFGLVLVVVNVSAPTYRWAFWLAEITHNLMLCALALQIIADVLPRRFVAPWAVFFFSGLLLSIARQWPATSTPALLNLSISAMCTAGLLLLALVFVGEIVWPRGYALAAIGLAAVLAGNLLPAVQWITGAVSPMALQLGDVPGLVILAWPIRARHEAPHLMRAAA
jgi:hypothetical protein